MLWLTCFVRFSSRRACCRRFVGMERRAEVDSEIGLLWVADGLQGATNGVCVIRRVRWAPVIADGSNDEQSRIGG